MYLLLVIFIIGILLFIRGLSMEKKAREDKRLTLQKQFGKRMKRSVGKERYDNLEKRLSALQLPFPVDSITWNDLGMKQIFEQMNGTLSACGEEALFIALHDQGISNAKLSERDKLITFFSDHEEIRLDLQMALDRLGFMGKYSLYDYLEYLTGQKKDGVVFEILMDFLYLPAIGILLMFPLPGMLILFALIIVQICRYLQKQKKMEPYLAAVGYLIRLSDSGKEIGKLIQAADFPLSKPQLEAFAQSIDDLNRISRKGNYVLLCNRKAAGGNSGSNPLELVFGYINMFFHFDQIRFQTILQLLEKKGDSIENLLVMLGELDMDIALASYRKSLNDGWCRPEFLTDTDTFSNQCNQNDKSSQTGPGSHCVSRGTQKHVLTMQEGYHPLIKGAVANDVALSKGILLTGSNASGKSTFLRMTAINAILAQSIDTCAAKQYRADRFMVYSSIALTDNLEAGDSYFLVEIKSIKRILDKGAAGEPVLCFVDEVLRGTNTVERIAASTQILLEFEKRGILAIAATHDLELTGLLSDSYENYHFKEEVDGSDVSFSYRLQKGPAVSKNAILLLRKLGFDPALADAAENLAARLDGERRGTLY